MRNAILTFLGLMITPVCFAQPGAGGPPQGAAPVAPALAVAALALALAALALALAALAAISPKVRMTTTS